MITALLFAAATAILTALRPVTMSSLLSGYPGIYAVDNNFDNFAHTRFRSPLDEHLARRISNHQISSCNYESRYVLQ